MLKKICVFGLFLCSTCSIFARNPANADSLLNILHLNDQYLREKKLIAFIKHDFYDNSIKNLYAVKVEIDGLLLKNKAENRVPLTYFIESIYQNRLSHLNEAENAMVKAIELEEKNTDHYLLYTFLSHLAFIQTDKGNAIGAISSYRLANKEALKLTDASLQVLIDINISDVYYKNNYYSQSLFYLDQAQAISAEHQLNDLRLTNLIYYNKSENYFRMNKVDSLKKYNEKLKGSKSKTDNLYTYTNRTDYYLFLLNHDYRNAIERIKALQKDSLYQFEFSDKQNLADAYYNAEQTDSAKYVIDQLLAGQEQVNHPEIKLHLYEVLGEIAVKKNDYKLANFNFSMALQFSKENTNKLTQVSNVSSLIKIDEIENFNNQKDNMYKMELLWLLFISVAALLIITVVALFYRNAKQKRHYERLLFTTQKEELAFINSHNVRRHLTNILGLLEVIKHSDDKEVEYLEAEDSLRYSAEQLDEAIKSISEKLTN